MEQRLFGPRMGIWRILDLLEQYEIKGTFFVPGIVAENHPDLLPAFVERGHEIGLHGYFHELAAQASDAEFTR
jgi:peptidoglycan/xylan/chitin deacetylase (PgdA/CDA1 family)